MVCRAALRSGQRRAGRPAWHRVWRRHFSVILQHRLSAAQWLEDPITPPKNFDHVTMFDVPYVMLVDLAGEAEAAATPNDTSYAGFAGVDRLPACTCNMAVSSIRPAPRRRLTARRLFMSFIASKTLVPATRPPGMSERLDGVGAAALAMAALAASAGLTAALAGGRRGLLRRSLEGREDIDHVGATSPRQRLVERSPDNICRSKPIKAEQRSRFKSVKSIFTMKKMENRQQK